MQYSIHAPTEFIRTHLNQLLPSWPLPILSVMVVIQLCQIALFERTIDTEIAKNQLRQQFIEFGSPIVLQLRGRGHLADMFDPRTGWPVTSPPGQLRLSDVKVVHSTLGYCITNNGPCSMIIHPTWGTAVYPSTLVSSAHPHIMEDVVGSVVSNMCNRLQQEPPFIASANSNLAYSWRLPRLAGASQYTTTPA
jgi:hypothetical protein